MPVAVYARGALRVSVMRAKQASDKLEWSHVPPPLSDHAGPISSSVGKEKAPLHRCNGALGPAGVHAGSGAPFCETLQFFGDDLEAVALQLAVVPYLRPFHQLGFEQCGVERRRGREH
jgi:hypothetical protein